MSKKLEDRVDQLERRLAAVETRLPAGNLAWVKHGGWAKNDPIYEEAVKLGAKWRKQQNRKGGRDARRR